MKLGRILSVTFSDESKRYEGYLRTVLGVGDEYEGQYVYEICVEYPGERMPTITLGHGTTATVLPDVRVYNYTVEVVEGGERVELI